PGSPSSPITSPSMGKKVSHHPLSQDGESPWTQFFQDAELSKTIESDVQRTFPDESYFRPAHIQERLVRILLIYCKLHEDISYRQGMHELAALILRVVDEDATADRKLQEVIQSTLSVKDVESDAFTLFLRVMSAVKPWYEFKEEQQQHSNKPGSHQRARSSDGLGPPQRIGTGGLSSSQPELPTTPILRKSYRIHHDYLRSIDPLLYKHLQSLEIEPQIYIMYVCGLP
ncbi:MAG: rab-GTPase-TBC domain-containing protein, partial [Piptocephalis tieghemiana]